MSIGILWYFSEMLIFLYFDFLWHPNDQLQNKKDGRNLTILRHSQKFQVNSYKKDGSPTNFDGLKAAGKKVIFSLMALPLKKKKNKKT